MAKGFYHWEPLVELISCHVRLPVQTAPKCQWITSSEVQQHQGLCLRTATYSHVQQINVRGEALGLALPALPGTTAPCGGHGLLFLSSCLHAPRSKWHMWPSSCGGWLAPAAWGRPGDSSECCDICCSTSWGEVGATSTLDVGHLRYIWTAGESRRLHVLPVAQNGILGKRLKSEPLAWISALATHFSSHSSRGWCWDKTFQAYLTERWLCSGEPCHALTGGQQAGHSSRHHPASPPVPGMLGRAAAGVEERTG